MAHMIMMATQANTGASPFFWYVTRTLAVGAYIALTLAVVLGLAQSITRTTGERLSWIVGELHTVVSVLAGVLVAGHLFTLLIDPFLPFSFVNLLVPVNEPFKPLAVNLGVFAFYTMIALLLSSYVRARISYGVWRAIHYLSFVAFLLVTLHGWMGGSDAVTNWAPAMYVGSSTAVGYMALVRMFTGDLPRSPAAPPLSPWQTTAARSVLVAVVIAVVSAGITLAVVNAPGTSAQIPSLPLL